VFAKAIRCSRGDIGVITMNSGGKVFDIVIVGAGAAGIGALWRLRGSGLSVLVLEARDRVGGRAATVTRAGLPLDLGCGWLHSADRNPLVPIARERGFTIDVTQPGWGRQADDRGFSREDQDEYADALDGLESRLEAAAKAGREGPAADWLEPGCRWNPLLDAFSGFYNGAEFDTVSVLDYAAYDDSGVNWRVREGYGALIAGLASAALAAGELALGTPVSMVDHSGMELRLETPRGAILARTAIVTLPTDLIARDMIEFRPPLPEKIEAAGRLPLGLANKLFLAIDQPQALPENGHVFGRTDRTETAGYHLRPFGRPVIEAFFGGRNARALEQGGPEAFAAFALDELAGLFGNDIRDRLTPLESTAWGLDPHAGGSYSHALPGFAGERARLAAPVDDRLFFAGEACSSHAFSTAHGAFETGMIAAGRAATALGAPIT
jgi:monoamine oxidase